MSSDQDTTWTVTLFSDGGANSSVATFPQTGNVPILLQQLPKASFVGTVNYATLCRIQITFANADAIDTALGVVTVVTETPSIHCVSPKLMGFTANPATMTQHLTLPQGPSFDGDLYASLSITNTAPSSATQINIQDVLPAGMSFQGDVVVVSPAGFNLGANPGIGSTGTINWTTTDSLAVGATLQFTFKVHLTMAAPGSLTNTFRAKALTDATYPAGDCVGDLTLNQSSKVPSLNQWGAIILSLLLAASAIWLLRRRRVS